jgi:hypothetical protein
MKFLFRRLFKKTNWYNLRSVTPVYGNFGFDRGKPVDRIYIEDFLNKHKKDIKEPLHK